MEGVQQHLRLFHKRSGQTGNLVLYRRIEQALARAIAWMLTTLYSLIGDRRNWAPLLARFSAHLAVVLVALMAVWTARFEWPALASSSPPVYKLPELGRVALFPIRGPDRSFERSAVSLSNHTILRLAQPHTVIPDRPRLSVITYTVQPGDTVLSIAEMFGLRPTTIMWADPAIEDAPDLLRIGQVVTILPIDGVYHKVAAGETLESIAQKYKVEPEAIATCEYNKLEPPDYAITEGMYLIVPGGEKPYVPKVVTTYTGAVPEGARGTGRFQWPVLGVITQGYWYGHRAIDIGAPSGSAVLASDGGFVSFAGWTDVGYGYLIVIDHANGFATYYAHLSGIYVKEGQAVARGDVIGAVGSTGWSQGPHLHFEVRYYGVLQNPRAYLP
ncbi:MAG: M23 family metallopeptidase [Anaerolineae bacterium]|nr:M23 family metallopeptidase [Anaerolineae bacterium]